MPTYYDYRKVYLTQEQSQNLTIALIVVLFVGMALNWAEPEVAFLIALGVLMLAEVLSIADTLAGFSNDGLITIGSLFLVVGAIEKSHLVDYGSRKAFGMNSSILWGKFRMYFSSFLISALFNNIPQVAIMIPVVKDWASLRKIPSSQLLIPLSYTVLAGGMLATIGTSTNLVVQGLLSADKAGREQFHFFDPAAIGAPAGMVLILYMLFAGRYLLPHYEDKISKEHERNFSHVLELTVQEDSYYAGKTVNHIFSGLGLVSENFIKIRRSVSYFFTLSFPVY